MSALKYPASLGWVRGRFTLFKTAPAEEDAIKAIIAAAADKKPADFEWGPVSGSGKTIRAVYRAIVPEPPAAPVESSLS